MKNNKKKKQISFEEREYLEYLRNDQDKSIGKISKILKRSKSTISVELKRIKNGVYDAQRAQSSRDRKQYHKTKDWLKVVEDKELQEYIEKHLKEDWSPEEIAGRIQFVDKYIKRITTPSIYKFIYSVYGRMVEKFLRYGKRKFNKEYQNKEKITGRTFIDQRPKKVKGRRFFGDWEADFVCSGKKGMGYLLVFIERKTRFVIIKKILKKDIYTVHKIFEQVLGVRFVINSLTIDNDIVFRKHRELSNIIGAPVFFTHPYHSWEKGTVENMNKWIRQYVPKRSDISSFSDEYIKMVEDKLNDRPRKCLKFMTPKEVILVEKSLKREIVMVQSHEVFKS